MAQGLDEAEAKMKSVEEFAIECAILKVHGSEVLDYAVDECVQIHGGLGYSAEGPAERGFRDARINRIFEGTNEINRLVTIDMLLKRAMKGELDLMTPAMNVQKELTSIPDFSQKEEDGLFSKEKKVMNNLKKVGLMVAGGAVQKLMMKLKEEQEILMNLAVNARDAMGEEGTIRIETKNIALDEEYCKNNLGVTPGDYVQLVLSDTGHGMDQGTVERIFEPFFTTKELGKGTGLGLSMVYGLIKKHDGYITCHSEPGQGSSFEMFFPAMEGDDQCVSKEEETDPRPSGDEVILVIDDDPLVRDLAEEILVRFGYRVLTAIDGESGLNTYLDNKETVSLIILDLMMPGMGGRRCLEEIMKINSHMRVVVASGYS